MAEARAHIPEGPDRPGPVLEPGLHSALDQLLREVNQARDLRLDRKSTRLNSSH